MKVSIKDLSVTMDPGNKGVTFDIYDNNDKFMGDIRLGRGTIEWCEGKTQAGNGIQVKWPDLIAYFEAVAAKKAQKEADKKAKAKAKPAAKK